MTGAPVPWDLVYSDPDLIGAQTRGEASPEPPRRQNGDVALFLTI